MTVDQELRKLALDFALGSRIPTHTGGVESVLKDAQQYYDFLTNKENTK